MKYKLHIISFLLLILSGKIYSQELTFQINKKQNKIFSLSSSSSDMQEYTLVEKKGKDSLIVKELHEKINWRTLMDSLKKEGFTTNFHIKNYNHKCLFKLYYSNARFDSICSGSKDSIFSFDLQITLISKKFNVTINHTYTNITTLVRPQNLGKAFENYNNWEFYHYRRTHIYEFYFDLDYIYRQFCIEGAYYWPFSQEEYFYR